MQSAEIREKSRKRNVWSDAEIRFFLSLVKEKQVVGLMDGKRLRVSDIFKTLVGPMKEQGFIRDSAQLVIKFKNLKADYYKSKRHNSISGNSPMFFAFFNEMDAILGTRPISQSIDTQNGFEIINDDASIIEQDYSQSNIEFVYEDAPDFDGEIPGTSADTPSTTCKKNVVETPKIKKNKNTGKGEGKGNLNSLEKFLQSIDKSQKEESEADRVFLDKFLEKQEEILMKFTNKFLGGLDKVLNKNRKYKNESSDSD